MQCLKIFLIFLIFYICAPNVNAQTSSRFAPDSLAARESFVLSKKLSLTATQTVGVEKAARIYHQKLQSLKAQQIADTAARNKLMRKQYKEYKKALKEIFTNMQYKSYKDFIEQRHTLQLQRAEQKGVKIKRPNIEND